MRARFNLLIWLVFLAGSGSATAAGPSGAEAADGDQVVATVNGRPVLARQLASVAETDRVRQRLGKDLTEQELLALRRRALERLIGRELLYQAARARHMRIPSRILNQQLEAARPQFPSSQAYREYLDRAGFTERELVEQVERKLLTDAYARQVTGRVKVNEREARKIYDEEKERFRIDERVRVAHIVILVPPGATPEDRQAARRRIDEVRRRALAGEDFGTLAREFSQSPFAEQGGDLGYLRPGRMRPEFDAAVFDAPIGEVTPVFETAYGLNLCKVLDRREASVRPFDEVKAGLLMHLNRERRRDALERHIRQLRAEARVVILEPELQPAG